MASRIAGITVEINGSTTGLSKALESVNKTIKTTQSELKDVERLLKLDPSNTELTLAGTGDGRQMLRSRNRDGPPGKAVRSRSRFWDCYGRETANRRRSGRKRESEETGSSTTCGCWRKKAGPCMRTAYGQRFRGAFGLPVFFCFVAFQCTEIGGTVGA